MEAWFEKNSPVHDKVNGEKIVSMRVVNEFNENIFDLKCFIFIDEKNC